MTQRPSRLRALHRGHAVLTCAVVVCLLALTLLDVITGATALRLLLTIEVPLLLVFAVVTARRFAGVARASDGTLLDRVAAEEPLLRGAIAELRAFASLLLLLAGRRRVAPGDLPFGYTRGTLAVPSVVIVLSALELAIVHLLVPWTWLRVALLVLSVWGMLFVLGVLASRAVHPHIVRGDELRLRWGDRTVLVTPLANVLSVEEHANHVHTQPHVEGGLLILTAFRSANVRIRLADPVRADAPVAKKGRPADVRASEVQLCVDDPAAFVRALRSWPEPAAT